MIKTLADQYLAQNAGRRYPFKDDTELPEWLSDAAILDFRCTVRGVKDGTVVGARLTGAERAQDGATTLTVMLTAGGAELDTLQFQVPGDIATNAPYTAYASGEKACGVLTVTAAALPPPAAAQLPYDAEVEYLESTGTQRIEIGMTFDASCVLDMTFRFTRFVNNATCHGQTAAGENQARFAFGKGAASWNDWYCGIGDKNYRTGTALDLAVHRFVVDAPGDKFVIDGTTYNVGRTAFALPSSPNNSAVLYNRARVNAADLDDFGVCGQLYRCQIHKNGVLVRDFIPVRVGTTGALYDRRGVGGMNPDGSPRNDGMYFNRGTGDFQYGLDVVPVEYIESHGTEYINTGFDITNAQSFAYDVKFSIAQSVSNAQPRLLSNEGAGYGNFYDIYFASNLLRVRQANVVVGNVQRNTPIVAKMTEQGRYYGYYESTPDTLLWDATRTFTSPTVKMNYKIFCRGNRTDTPYRWQGRAWYMRFRKDGAPVHVFRPVRVGTDATSWEGAMMDTLTRRIYRNAGTGDFGYGDDVQPSSGEGGDASYDVDIPFAATTVVCDSLKVDSIQSAQDPDDALDKDDPADLDVTVAVSGDVELAEGRNAEPYLDGNRLRIDVFKGGGLGERCQGDSVDGAAAGQTCGTVLFTVNGERPGSDGELRIIGEDGITVTPYPEDHAVEIRMDEAAAAKMTVGCAPACQEG